jgi:hypothetical protein
MQDDAEDEDESKPVKHATYLRSSKMLAPLPGSMRVLKQVEAALGELQIRMYCSTGAMRTTWYRSISSTY